MLRMFVLSSSAKALKLTRNIVQSTLPMAQDNTGLLHLRQLVADSRRFAATKLMQMEPRHVSQVEASWQDDESDDGEQPAQGVRCPSESPLSRLCRLGCLPEVNPTEACRAKLYSRQVNDDINSFIAEHNRQFGQVPLFEMSQSKYARSKHKPQLSAFEVQHRRSKSVGRSRIQLMRNMYREPAGDVKPLSFHYGKGRKVSQHAS